MNTQHSNIHMPINAFTVQVSDTTGDDILYKSLLQKTSFSKYP